jgi:hypothetical protein
MIEKSVMKIHETKNCVMYRLECDCRSPECDLILDLERDEDGFVFLNLYKDLEWASYWGDDPWYTRIWRRITCSIRVLFKGYIKVEGTFVMREDQLDGFMKALKEGREQIKE